MKISRESNSNAIPEWLFSKEEPKIQDLNIHLPKISSQADIVNEKDNIEKCAKNNGSYYVDESLPTNVKKELKEYARACDMNMKNFQEVSQDLKENIKIASAEQTFTKSGKKSVQVFLKDPFKLDEVGNMDHMEKADWQKVTKQQNLKEDSPSILTGAVKSIRGGEDTTVNSDYKDVRGKNSIVNPNAIKELVENKEEDGGTRIRNANLQRKEQIKQDKKEWEDNIVKSMKGNSIIPKGKVFATESMNAQPGLDNPISKRFGVYSKFDKNSVPDKTEGEKIAENNKSAKESIQRNKPEDKEWNDVKGSSRWNVNETFAENLKRGLEKVKGK